MGIGFSFLPDFPGNSLRPQQSAASQSPLLEYTLLRLKAVPADRNRAGIFIQLLHRVEADPEVRKNIAGCLEWLQLFLSYIFQPQSQ